MSRFFRPNIARMAGYVPGEQPRDGGFIKLNTNENPYPPSPRVKAAIVGGGDRPAPPLPRPDVHRVVPDRRAVARGRARDGPGGQWIGRPPDDRHPRVRRAGRPGGLRVAELPPLFDPDPAPGRPRRDGALLARLDARPRRAGRPRPQAGLPGQPRQPLGHRDAARARSPSCCESLDCPLRGRRGLCRFCRSAIPQHSPARRTTPT